MNFRLSLETTLACPRPLKKGLKGHDSDATQLRPSYPQGKGPAVPIRILPRMALMRFILFIYDIYYLYIHTDTYIYIYTFIYFFKVQTRHVSTNLSQQLQHGNLFDPRMRWKIWKVPEGGFTQSDILSWIKTWTIKHIYRGMYHYMIDHYMIYISLYVIIQPLFDWSLSLYYQIDCWLL